MTFNSLYLIGTVLSLIGILTTAFEFSNNLKYTISGVSLLLTLPLLLVNFYFLITSPFSRGLYLKSEMYKLIFCDGFDIWNKKKSLLGDAIYCNQSLVPKTLINDYSNLSFKNENEEDPYVIFEKEERISVKGHQGREQEIVYRLSGNPDSYKVEVVKNPICDLGDTFKIGQLIIKIYWSMGSGNIEMSYPGVQKNVIRFKGKYEMVAKLIYIMNFHGNNPETGLCRLSKNIRKVRRLHSLSYQEIIKKLESDPVLILNKVSGVDTVVEGEDKVCLPTEAFSYLLKDKLMRKFGGGNEDNIIKHNLGFWGKINFKALDFVASRKNGLYYSLFGTNWQSKRYLTDVSYLREKAGMPRMSNITLSIKPTLLAREIGKSMVKNENCKEGLYAFNISELKEMNKKVMMSNETNDPRKKKTISKMIAMKYSKKTKIKKEDIKRIKEFIEPNKKRIYDNVDLRNLGKVKVPTIDLIPEKKIVIGEKSVIKDYNETTDMIQDAKIRADYKEALLKTANELKDRNLKSLKKVDLRDYIKTLSENKEGGSLKYKKRAVTNLFNYEGYQPTFPIEPGFTRLKRSEGAQRRANDLKRYKALRGANEGLIDSEGTITLKGKNIGVLKTKNCIFLKNYFEVLMESRDDNGELKPQSRKGEEGERKGAIIMNIPNLRKKSKKGVPVEEIREQIKEERNLRESEKNVKIKMLIDEFSRGGGKEGKEGEGKEEKTVEEIKSSEVKSFETKSEMKKRIKREKKEIEDKNKKSKEAERKQSEKIGEEEELSDEYLIRTDKELRELNNRVKNKRQASKMGITAYSELVAIFDDFKMKINEKREEKRLMKKEGETKKRILEAMINGIKNDKKRGRSQEVNEEEIKIKERKIRKMRLKESERNEVDHNLIR